jgi:hypothetical protein
MPVDRDNNEGGVGYGKPPQHTQFAKGRSGNPRGRPKGRKNLSTLIEEELNTKVTITENGARKKITKKQAVAKQIVNKAASGDPKAVPVLLNEARQREAVVGETPAPNVVDRPEDHLVIQNIVRRIRAGEEMPQTEAPNRESTIGSDSEAAQ